MPGPVLYVITASGSGSELNDDQAPNTKVYGQPTTTEQRIFAPARATAIQPCVELKAAGRSCGLKSWVAARSTNNRGRATLARSSLSMSGKLDVSDHDRVLTGALDLERTKHISSSPD